HLGTTEVEVAVLETQDLVRLNPILDRERRGVGLGQHVDRVGGDLDLTRGEAGVLGARRSGANAPRHLDDGLRPKAPGDRVRPGGVLRMGDDLDEALAVTQVEEDHAAMVALAGDPTLQDDAPPGVLEPKRPAHVGPATGKLQPRSPRAAMWAIASSIPPSSCTPSASRFHVTVPARASWSPTITT